MSSALDKSLAGLRESMLDVIWGQWTAVGASGAGRMRPARAIVDPEALVLMTCQLRDTDKRLWDFAAGFAAEASELLSFQRTRNLAKAFPPEVSRVLAEFGAVALRDGKDARWSEHGDGPVREYRPGKFSIPQGGFMHEAALFLRLRQAFGVHARTDVITFLLASQDPASTANEIADATGYGQMPVRRACESMAASRILIREGGRPQRYRVRKPAWSELLEAGIPKWRHWRTLFAFIAHVLDAWGGSKAKQQSAYLASGAARRLVLEHAVAFRKNRIEIPEPGDYPGESYLAAFATTLDAVRKALESKS